MSDVVLVDTSVFLNVLDVPSFNQDRDDVLKTLEDSIIVGDILLLPIASIIETGNHVVRLSDGGDRRRFAQAFCDQVNMAINGEAPWRAMRPPDLAMFRAWIQDFPEHAMRQTSLGDLSIIREWEVTCRLHTGSRVRVWALDHGFAHCDRQAQF